MGNYLTSTTENNKGNHVFLDFTNFHGNEYDLGKKVFDIMINAIENTNMKIVHKHLEILNGDTPAGFTSVILLDESHATSHCYSEDGLLAIDLFTCGSTDTVKVMENIKEELFKEFPNLKCTYFQNHKRFNY